MKIIILTLCTLTPFFISSCATEAKYKASLKTWDGKNIKQFVKHWGYPDRSVKLQDGNKAYIYIDHNHHHNPAAQMPLQASSVDQSDSFAYAGTPGVITGGNIQTYHCKTWVVFNQDQIIIDISFKGNDCVAY